MILKRLIDSYTKENINYEQVSIWRDGTVMDDTKVDNAIYRKKDGQYYERKFSGSISALWFGVKSDAFFQDSMGNFFSDEALTIPATDNTNALNNAIKASVGRELHIPDGKYMVNTDAISALTILSNTHLYMSSNAYLMLKSTSKSAYDMFAIVNKENITIQGGHIVGDKYWHKVSDNINKIWKEFMPNTAYVVDDYVYASGIGYRISVNGISGATAPIHTSGTVVNGTASFEFYKNGIGEGGYGVFFGNSYGVGQIDPNTGIEAIQNNNIHISNMNIEKFWGDGICFAAYHVDGTVDTTNNVLVENVICDDNRRQGISVVSAKKISILNSRFMNTSGTLPQCGIDVEPNANNVVEDLTIHNCWFDNNKGGGLYLIANNIAGRVTNADLRALKFDNNVKEDLLIGQNATNIFVDGVNITQPSTKVRPSIVLNKCDGVVVRNVFSDNTTAFGAIWIQFGKNIEIDNFKMKNTIVGFIEAISISYDIDNVRIKNSTLKSTDSSIKATSGVSGIRKNLLIENCDVYTVTERAINLNTVDYATIRKTTISNSGREGILLNNCKSTIIDKCILVNSVITTGTAYPAITLMNSPNFKVIDSIIKKPAEGSKITYPINVDSNSINGLIRDNDMTDAWTSGVFSDYPASTKVVDINLKEYGATAERPLLSRAFVPIGYRFYDTTLNKSIFVSATRTWVDATGTNV